MGNILHITSGRKLSLHREQVKIMNEEGSETCISLEDVSFCIVETSRCFVSAQLQLECVKRKIPLILCDEYHHPYAHTLGVFNHFHVTKRLKEQIVWKDTRKEDIERSIIKRKIKHQRQVLELIDAKDTIEQLKRYEENIELKTSPIQSQEAVASRMYFQALFGTTFRRFEEDALNGALNYGYMILRSLIATKIVAKGLHPSLGLFHTSQLNSYNLADDIIEVFRPMIDCVVWKYPPKEERLTKEERQRLLHILQQEVVFKRSRCSLDVCIELYIDSIVETMNTGKKISLPTLEIEEYVNTLY